MGKINKTKHQVVGKVYKTGKSLATLTKKKKNTNFQKSGIGKLTLLLTLQI